MKMAVSTDTISFKTRSERRDCRSCRDAWLEMDTGAVGNGHNRNSITTAELTSPACYRELHAPTSRELGIIHERLKPRPTSPYTQSTMVLFHLVSLARKPTR
jgi:hypothetical protein